MKAVQYYYYKGVKKSKIKPFFLDLANDLGKMNKYPHPQKGCAVGLVCPPSLFLNFFCYNLYFYFFIFLNNFYLLGFLEKAVKILFFV